MRALELDIRLRGPFSIAFVTAEGEDLRSYYGAGFRVDIPGFLFIGGDVNRYAKAASKRYPVNTSMYALFISRETEDSVTNVATRSVGSELGLTMDIFLFNHFVFATTQASAVNLSGNLFLSYAFGLGIQF